MREYALLVAVVLVGLSLLHWRLGVLLALLVGGAISLENQGGVRNITTPGFGSMVKAGAVAPEPPRPSTAAVSPAVPDEAPEPTAPKKKAQPEADADEDAANTAAICFASRSMLLKSSS